MSCHLVFFNNTIIAEFRYIIIETKEVVRTQVTPLVLHISAFTRVLMRKKKPVISNTGRFCCFNSTVSYTCSTFCIIHRFLTTFPLLINADNRLCGVIVRILASSARNHGVNHGYENTKDYKIIFAASPYSIQH